MRKKLIDKDALVAEIERLYKKWEMGNYVHEKLISFIDTFEVKEINSTDAFIEKAAEWLNNFYNEDTHSYLINEDIKKFINYMKGE